MMAAITTIPARSLMRLPPKMQILWLLLLVITQENWPGIVLVRGAEPACNCQFQVSPSDEAGCRVYGQLQEVATANNSSSSSSLTSKSMTTDNPIIPWYRANDTCLQQAFNISERVVDIDPMWLMCPYANNTNVDATALINYLQFSPSPAADTLKAMWTGGYFVSNGTNYVLPEVIVTQRKSVVNCTASVRLCWDAILVDLTTDPVGLAQTCATLHLLQAAALAREQSQVRIQLCQDLTESSSSSSASALCEPLSSQVAQVSRDYPGYSCAAYGQAAEASDLPNPATCGATQSTSSAATLSRSNRWWSHLLGLMVITTTCVPILAATMW